MSGAKLTEAESVVMRCIWNYGKDDCFQKEPEVLEDWLFLNL